VRGLVAAQPRMGALPKRFTSTSTVYDTYNGIVAVLLLLQYTTARVLLSSRPVYTVQDVVRPGGDQASNRGRQRAGNDSSIFVKVSVWRNRAAWLFSRGHHNRGSLTLQSCHCQMPRIISPSRQSSLDVLHSAAISEVYPLSFRRFASPFRLDRFAAVAELTVNVKRTETKRRQICQCGMDDNNSRGWSEFMAFLV
jgi:hypothetical protein